MAAAIVVQNPETRKTHNNNTLHEKQCITFDDVQTKVGHFLGTEQPFTLAFDWCDTAQRQPKLENAFFKIDVTMDHGSWMIRSSGTDTMVFEDENLERKMHQRDEYPMDEHHLSAYFLYLLAHFQGATVRRVVVQCGLMDNQRFDFPVWFPVTWVKLMGHMETTRWYIKEKKKWFRCGETELVARNSTTPKNKSYGSL